MKRKPKFVTRAKYDVLLERYEAAKRIIDNLMPKREYDLTAEDIIAGEVIGRKVPEKLRKEK